MAQDCDANRANPVEADPLRLQPARYGRRPRLRAFARFDLSLLWAAVSLTRASSAGDWTVKTTQDLARPHTFLVWLCALGILLELTFDFGGRRLPLSCVVAPAAFALLRVF